MKEDKTKDPTLERIWEARNSITKRDGYDAKTLVAQSREREEKAKKTEIHSEPLVAREPDHKPCSEFRVHADSPRPIHRPSAELGLRSLLG